MPKSEAYLAGYGLAPGITLAGFTLSSIHSGHEMVTRYREYRYPTTMTWMSQVPTDPTLLVNTLNQYLATPRRIYSEYGNPYSCTFGQVYLVQQNGSQVTLGANGICQRVY